MKIQITDYAGRSATYDNIVWFDFNGETGEMDVQYNDDNVSRYTQIQRVKLLEV